MNGEIEKSTGSQHRREQPFSHSMRLLTIFGIEIRLDISVIVIFLLIVYSLGSGIFPQWHPDWSPQLLWGTALVSGVLFFASLLAHEISHSVVAQKFGIPVPRITLFLFGGMAETSREPDRPKIEFFIAIAGPLMSILISVICSNLAVWVSGDPELVDKLKSTGESALTQLGPLSTSLLWLGSINMVLAVFNLIPGFPMDGGRVFRAIVWGVTGDLMKATRWASNMGRYFGWALMALGVVNLFGGGGFAGVWWILIGWFISSLAAMSYRQLMTDRALRELKISDLMRTQFDHVRAEMALPEFIEHHLLRSTQQLWPVIENDQLIGLISLLDVVELSPQERSRKSVRDVMHPVASVNYLEADANARDAFRYLASTDEPLPVVRQDKMVGLVQRGDILKWMSFHEMESEAARS